MIKSISVTNHLGDTVQYLVDGLNDANMAESGLIITNVEGLGPVKANINMTELANTDGTKFNSSRLTGRNIVITGYFTHAATIEEARYLSYKYFPIGKPVEVEVVTDGRQGSTIGYVESNTPYIFEEKTYCSVSILCESPFMNGGRIDYNLSKSANTVNRINYAGDTETGVEVIIAVDNNHTKDINITSFTMAQDGEKSISLDISKMEAFVPNTSPTKAQQGECHFTFSYATEEYRYFSSQPTNYDADYSSVVVFNGVAHFLGHSGMHYVIDEDGLWREMNTTPSPGLNNNDTPTRGVVFNDKIYILCDALYHWVEATDEWIKDDDLPYPIHKETCVVTYNGAIHVLGDSILRSRNGDIMDIYQASEYTQAHYKWNGTSWVQLSNLPYPFDGGYAVVWDNKIHIMGRNIVTTTSDSSQRKKHYSFNGSAWSSQSTAPSPLDFGTAVVVAFEGGIHVFKGTSHWKYYGVSWALGESSPNAMFTTNRLAYDLGDHYLHFIGGMYTKGGAGSYTEPPNNAKVIAGDVIIINTNKGKKSAYLYRKGLVHNIVNILGKNPDWFELHNGVNRFVYNAGSNSSDIQVTISANALYAGM